MDKSAPPAASDELTLVMSGPGLAAAAFHLGGLDALHSAGRLGHVTALYASAGASMCAARYMRALLAGEQFNRFFSRFGEFLESVDARAQSLCDVFELELVSGLRWGALLDDSPLKDFCLSAVTENTGAWFHFRCARDLNGGIGYPQDVLAPALAREMRLADVMAVCAHKTGALSFPRDYRWPGEAPAHGDSVPLVAASCTSTELAQELAPQHAPAGVVAAELDNTAPANQLAPLSPAQRHEMIERGRAATMRALS